MSGFFDIVSQISDIRGEARRIATVRQREAEKRKEKAVRLGDSRKIVIERKRAELEAQVLAVLDGEVEPVTTAYVAGKAEQGRSSVYKMLIYLRGTKAVVSTGDSSTLFWERNRNAKKEGA